MVHNESAGPVSGCMKCNKTRMDWCKSSEGHARGRVHICNSKDHLNSIAFGKAP